MNLKNKKVIITGATGGIGNSLVKKFSENGSVVLATGTKEDKLNDSLWSLRVVVLQKSSKLQLMELPSSSMHS